ncbi:hypothetical protein JQC92_07145 [Shewanella sp. 202IG2-18]|uniref:hypothetical protein n=1 Tax=Parashewanella hymeniacidonis TaxID=2807618 RepID=UPI001961D44B|nr:hypothetical protein [Parashewanella hymeniacidonis]MBM7071818.1 hypothetical protein [Parashewanella hymeniacidonis]
MDWLLTVKFIAAAIGIFTAWKSLQDIFNNKKSNLREEYKFAKAFFEDLKADDLHPYVLTKGYQAIAGTTSLTNAEIEYILSLKNPLQCLRDFNLSKNIFEKLETTGDLSLIYKPKYSKKSSRTWRKIMYISLYGILGFGAMSPFLFANLTERTLQEIVSLILFVSPICAFNAWLAIKAYFKLERAEYLFSNRTHHSPKIIVN